MSSEATTGDRATQVGLRGTLGWVWTVFGPFLGLLLISGLFAWLTRHSGTFMTASAWRTIAVQTVIVAIAVLGMTAVMIAGGIDLSVGSVVALVTVVVAKSAIGFTIGLPDWLGGLSVNVPAAPLPVAMLVGVLAGGLCGLLNGALITRLRVVPFIITLGSLKAFRGLADLCSDSTSVYVPNVAKTPWFDSVLSISRPNPSWLVVAPGVWILLWSERPFCAGAAIQRAGTLYLCRGLE